MLTRSLSAVMPGERQGRREKGAGATFRGADPTYISMKDLEQLQDGLLYFQIPDKRSSPKPHRKATFKPERAVEEDGENEIVKKVNFDLKKAAKEAEYDYLPKRDSSPKRDRENRENRGRSRDRADKGTRRDASQRRKKSRDRYGEKPRSQAEVEAAVQRIQEILNTYNKMPKGPTMVTDYLYLGDMANAMSIKALKRLGVTHVLNCASPDTDLSPRYSAIVPKNFIYKQFDAFDDDDYDISQHMEEAHWFIEQARMSGGTVLVHCLAGINRSGFMTVSHLVLRGLPLLRAVILLHSVRGQILTNETFQEKMVTFAKSKGRLT